MATGCRVQDRAKRFVPPHGTRRDRVVANRCAAMAQAPFPAGPGIMLRRMSCVKSVPSQNHGANASISVVGPGKSGSLGLPHSTMECSRQH